MYTSYYAKYKGNNGISIAGKCPSFYKGKEYKKLAPKYTWWKNWKDGLIDNNEYIKLYYETVLNKLDPQQVYNELGENAVLLCWENKDKFCHRHIVAKWLENNLNVKVTELD